MSARPAAATVTSWWEWAVVVAGSALAVVGVVVWCGAALAARLAGKGWPVPVPDGSRAAIHLPGHLGDPAAAWPPSARDRLPGPVLYWLATSVPVAALVGLVAVGVWGWRWWHVPDRVRLGVDVRARFAEARDLFPVLVERPIPAGRFVLGVPAVAPRRLVATEDRHSAPTVRRRREDRVGDRASVAIVGPARSGKSATAVAGLLEWEHPAVVISVKRDLIDATVTRRSRLGEVAVLDPSGVSGIDPARRARWSPLRAAGTPTGAHKAAAALAAAIPRTGVDGGMDYWTKQAEILLTGVLGAAGLESEWTMTDVARWVFVKDMPTRNGRPSEILAVLQRAIDDGDGTRKASAEAAILQLDAIWRLDERVRSSVYATVQTVVQPWLDPTVGLSAVPRSGRGWVDLDWLCAEGTANTLYLVSPLDDQRRLAPVLGGVLGDLKDQAYQWDVAGRKMKAPLLMLVDEAGNMPLSWLPEVASTCAGIGILLVTIWQSKSQLDSAYGRLADSVLTNHGTKVIFAGCSDAATLEYVSRLLGEEEIVRRSWSADIGGGRRSVSETEQRERLTPYHLLRQVRPGEAVLVHGTLPPVHLLARRWWTDPHLTALHVTGEVRHRSRIGQRSVRDTARDSNRDHPGARSTRSGRERVDGWRSDRSPRASRRVAPHAGGPGGAARHVG